MHLAIEMIIRHHFFLRKITLVFTLIIAIEIFLICHHSFLRKVALVFTLIVAIEMIIIRHHSFLRKVGLVFTLIIAIENSLLFTPVPGWNQYLSEPYNESRQADILWSSYNKPRSGPVHEFMKIIRARFKYAQRLVEKKWGDVACRYLSKQTKFRKCKMLLKKMLKVATHGQ